MINSFSDDLYIVHSLRASHELEMFPLFCHCCTSLHLFGADALNLEVAVALTMISLLKIQFQDGDSIYLNS